MSDSPYSGANSTVFFSSDLGSGAFEKQVQFFRIVVIRLKV
jgi:hypothetical protein